MKKNLKKSIAMLLCLFLTTETLSTSSPAAIYAAAASEAGISVTSEQTDDASADTDIETDTSVITTQADDEDVSAARTGAEDVGTSGAENGETSGTDTENTEDETVSGNTGATDEQLQTTVPEETDPDAEELSADGETTDPSDDTSVADTSSTITATFYDTDKTTVLFSVPMTYEGYDIHLISVDENSQRYSPVLRGYGVDYWYCISNDKTYTPYKVYNNLNFRRDMAFYPVLETEPYEYCIRYDLVKGAYFDVEDTDAIPTAFTMESDTITLLSPSRLNYLFGGWYTDATFQSPIKEIKKGTVLSSTDNIYYDKDFEKYGIKLYAKWITPKPAKPAKPTVKNTGTGKMTIKITPVSGVDGYEVAYSSDKNCKKNVLKKDLAKKTSFTLTNLPSKKTYGFKVRSYQYDSTGKKHYSAYSAVTACKVKKGVKEYPAKSNSGQLKKVTVKNKNELYVQATIKKRLKSSDDCYYLVKIDPANGKVLKSIARTDKSQKVVFELPLTDENGTNHIQGKFAVAVKKGKKYIPVTAASFISNPEDAASYTAPFPTPASKKGRQGKYEQTLGDKNYFNNFCLDSIMATKSSHSVAYKYNGKTYYFYEPSFGEVAAANADGGTVTIQVMLQWSSANKNLILKSGRTPGAHYYAFNTEERAAREKLEAAFSYITEYASREGYHVDNWILGNEVNTYRNMTAKWYYAGNISNEKFMKSYASAFRMLYYAARSHNKNARVYICCDHTWINREQDWGTRYFTAAFDKAIKAENKNIKWNLAYHCYSAVLTNADFWNDGSLAKNSLGSDFVSPNNLSILTNYIKDNFGKDVRIILSEQGFSCSGGVGSPYNAGRQSGENVQAAAVAWLYYKAQFNDMIDAVIFSSGDHGGAGYQFDFIGRKAENVYKYMDTPKYKTYTKTCLQTIGKSSWSSAVSGFSDKKMKKMPTR